MTKIIFRIFALTVLIQSATAAVATSGKRDTFSISWADKVNEHPKFNVNENLIPERNETCKNNGVCDNINNYPEDLAGWVLHQLVRKNIIEFTMEKTVDISNTDSSLSLCNSTEMQYFPKAAYSAKSKTWEFILNLDIAHFQGFYVNICNTHESCNGLTSLWNSRCEQTYIEKKMIYLDLKEKMTKVDTFNVPVCCFCKII